MGQTPATPAEYVQHHLDHLMLNLHTLKLGNGGFWTINLDTMFVSVFLGLLFVGLFWRVAKTISSDGENYFTHNFLTTA